MTFISPDQKSILMMTLTIAQPMHFFLFIYDATCLKYFPVIT
jgi:hypothetical protein